MGFSICSQMERAMGIEPTLFAWEAKVLPLNDARLSFRPPFHRGCMVLLTLRSMQALHALCRIFQPVLQTLGNNLSVEYTKFTNILPQCRRPSRIRHAVLRRPFTENRFQKEDRTKDEEE